MCGVNENVMFDHYLTIHPQFFFKKSMIVTFICEIN
jgi:hypothetical protein